MVRHHLDVVNIKRYIVSTVMLELIFNMVNMIGYFVYFEYQADWRFPMRRLYGDPSGPTRPD